MLRVELVTQLRRVRTLVLFGVLAAIPVLAAATQAGGRHGATTFSALNFAESGLNFMDPVLFGLVVAAFGSILAASDREWGTLRYRYVRPVHPRRLLAGKAWTLCICSVLTIVTFLVPAVVAGYAAFGWHPFHRSGTQPLPAATAIGDILAAAGYLTVCLLSVGFIALALGLLLPRSTEALAASVAFVIGSALLDGVPALRSVVELLPVHYWMRWTELFDSVEGGASGLVVGLAVQTACAAVALTLAYALLSRRDPAA